jgi:hypothetical protein
MTLKQQRGMTMWSAAFVICVAVFFLFLFFKLLPPYLEDLKVSTAINGLASEANAGTMSKTELVHRLEKRFDIDNVTNVKPNQLTIEARGKVKYMRLSYEVVVPMMYNVSALLEFDHAHEVTVTE